jgi:hypothetical protein
LHADGKMIIKKIYSACDSVEIGVFDSSPFAFMLALDRSLSLVVNITKS